MKKYIKPNTELHNIELQSMIAGTAQQEKVIKSGSATEWGAKENEITSPSLWEEEE